MKRNYADLVEDSLLYRQSMQTLKDGCHVLTSASIHYEPGSSFESRLHSPDDTIRHTVKNGITIVDATGDEGMNEGLSSIRWERSANGTKLPELEEAALHTLFTWSSIVSLQSIMIPRSRTESRGKISAP